MRRKGEEVVCVPSTNVPIRLFRLQIMPSISPFHMLSRFCWLFQQRRVIVPSLHFSNFWPNVFSQSIPYLSFSYLLHIQSYLGQCWRSSPSLSPSFLPWWNGWHGCSPSRLTHCLLLCKKKRIFQKWQPIQSRPLSIENALRNTRLTYRTLIFKAQSLLLLNSSSLWTKKKF